MKDLVNLDLERLAIGLLLQASRYRSTAKAAALLERSGLLPEHFATALHRDALSAAQVLLRQARPATPEAIVAVAVASKAIAGAGGARALAELEAASVAEPEAALPQYAESLRKLSLLRRAEAFLRGAHVRATSPVTDPAELLGDVRRFAEDAGSSVVEYRTCAEDTYALAERIEANVSGHRQTVVPTGIVALDEAIRGLRPTLTVLGGLPGVGKSALVASLLGNLAERGIRCGLFGLEDGTQWVTDRLTAREAKVSVEDLDHRRLFTTEERERLQEAHGRVAHWMGQVEKCAPPGKLQPAQLVNRAKDWVLNRGVKVIVVDHIGELEHGNARERFDLSIAESLSQLRSIATRHQVPVVAVAHLRRSYDKGGKPTRPLLSDFAESAYIERMARLALGVWEGEDGETVNVTVLKHTFGRAGQTVALRRIRRAALVSNVGGRAVEQLELEVAP